MARAQKNDVTQEAPVLTDEENNALAIMAADVPASDEDVAHGEGDQNDVTQEAPVLTDEENNALAIMAADVPALDEDVAHGEGDHEEPDGVLVVVCKGHTLYHNGEKYPQSNRLRMEETDAAPLIQRGVVVKYDDLLKQVQSHAG